MEAEEIIGVVEKVLQSKKRRFRESVDLYINLKNIDMNQPKNRINMDIVLPKKFREPKVAVFASGEMALRAKEAGADVIEVDELKKMDKKKAREIAKKYDFFVAEASLMPLIGRSLGVILGPRGKMPEPVPPNADIAAILKRLERTVRIRTKSPEVKVKIGHKEMDPRDIAENAVTVINRIEGKLEKGWQNIASIYMKTTMGPAVRVV
ncbi:MAG: 50S ribosomal protein L1 [Candidatus Methanospirareceae archaeon]